MALLREEFLIKIPIKYLGIGEGQPFDRDLFIDSLFNKEY